MIPFPSSGYVNGPFTSIDGSKEGGGRPGQIIGRIGVGASSPTQLVGSPALATYFHLIIQFN